jgi:glutamate N-acetyltransferase/amino-acid N-acetyltransferase
MPLDDRAASPSGPLLPSSPVLSGDPMDHAVSPLAPKSVPDMPPVAGVRFATAEAGIKYRNRTDVLLVALDEGTEVAGVFTRSKCPSAPVDWCRTALAGGKARALLVNSGNANAFTGMKGRDTVRVSAEHAALALGIRPEEVFLASTGVIGEPLDPAKFEVVLEGTAARLDDGPWIEAARAIMTTDTFPKVATRRVDLGGTDVVLNGIAKGAGMIAPDMATMLSFVFTDAPIAAPVLQSLLDEGVRGSFNAITVDSDTSTSDTLLLFATGAAAAPRITNAGDPRLQPFRVALHDLLRDLAHQVVRDGEGARKFVAVTVTGATDDPSAKRIALSIANSPLVKTAIAGEDANWGRIVMAVGKAGEPADRDRLSIWFGAVRVAVEGARDPSYSEAATSEIMRRDEIDVRVDLGLGEGRATVWTCDLTQAYVAINGDYRS